MPNFRESDSGDIKFVESLLKQNGLPLDVLHESGARLYIAESIGRPVGTAGFEFYGHDALLRSVAVNVELQHKGLGSRIVDFMLEEAKRRNVRRVVLLTETARDFFLKKGFAVIARSEITNPALLASPEFTHACPQSAVCMQLILDKSVM